MLLTILIAFISLVALLIVHELGHFVFAKIFNVKVEEFGLGYPPRLIAKRVGETVYSLNLLPFGAFVKILGEQQASKPSSESEAALLLGKHPRSFTKKPIWQRCLIVLAGGFSFWLMAALLLSIVAAMVIQDISWWEACLRGLMATAEITFLIIKGLSLALVNALKGLPTGLQLMGPIGVFSLFGKAAAQGATYFLYFISVIAIHLAIINLFPIPALDGGKLLFLGIEKLKGSPVDEKVERRITMFFFALLVALMILVTIKDVSRISNF